MINDYYNKYKTVYSKDSNKISESRYIYWGEVVSVNDKYGGGSLKVRIPELDNNIEDINLSDCYPLLPKYFHILPKKGEIVRIFIENNKYPQRGRLWIGSIISQLQKISYDNIYTALSTTHLGVVEPEKNIDEYPDAKDVFPDDEDIALIGRENNDIILKKNSTLIRVGKHLDGNLYKLNKKNIGLIQLDFNNVNNKKEKISEAIFMFDKIALLTHNGDPKIKSYDIDNEYKNKIFKSCHPLAKADYLIEYLEIIRNTLINHIHPYSGLPSDKSGALLDLVKIDFNKIKKEDIVTN